MKRRKRPPTLPPTQYLRPELMVEETEDEVLKRRRARGRKIGAERRHLDAQLTEKDLAAIDADRGRHPNANSTQIAGRLQRNPATAVPHRKRGKPVLKDGKPVLLTVEVLARKITRARLRK